MTITLKQPKPATLPPPKPADSSQAFGTGANASNSDGHMPRLVGIKKAAEVLGCSQMTGTTAAQRRRLSLLQAKGTPAIRFAGFAPLLGEAPDQPSRGVSA